MGSLKKITWYRGDSYPIEITIKNKETEAAIDLTDYSFKLTVDEIENPTDSATKLFDVVGALDADPATGKVSFTPTESDTDLDVGTYYYDVQMIDGSSHKRTIAKNEFEIVQDISK